MSEENSNLYRDYHQQLVDQPGLMKQKVMAVCRWSNTKFYEMLKNPSAISVAEKMIIAQIYEVPVSVLFAEMANFDITENPSPILKTFKENLTKAAVCDKKVVTTKKYTNSKKATI